MICRICITECELSPANEPYSPEHWICPKCDSTYVLEDHCDDTFDKGGYGEWNLSLL